MSTPSLPQARAAEPSRCHDHALVRPAWRRLGLSAIMLAALAACGGGGGGAGDSPFPDPTPTPGGGGTPAPATAQSCAPTNPHRGDALQATTEGSLDIEKAWVRAYMGNAYLWNTEIPDVNPAVAHFSNTRDVPSSLDNYFQALKTPAYTPSGKLKDQFSFTYPTKDWNQLSQSGQVQGYGLTWLIGSATPPRQIAVAWVEPGSVAATAGLRRGDVLVSVDDISADTGNSAHIDALNEALYPSTGGGTHRFVFQRGDGQVSAGLTAGTVQLDPVPVTQVVTSPAGRKVGYVLFNDHIATSEAGLIQAVQTLKAAAVQDLVLDLRYNGGGYLYIASQLAYMVAGPARTAGQVFEQLSYNASRAADTASADARTPFYDTSCLLSADFLCTREEPLPTLNLARVTVLAGAGTCSASEAIVNGLRGVDVEVILVGETTCGKPYGFTARDNCGISYFPIEFQGVNAKGFGDYADGMAATCSADDDLSQPLGSASEGRLAAALNRLDQGRCASTVSATGRRQALAWKAGGPVLAGARVLRGPEREAAIRRTR